MQGVPFDRIRSAEKKPNKKKRNETNLWSRIYFWKHKKICGLVRESSPRSPASQKISRTNVNKCEQRLSEKWTTQSEIVN